MTMMRSYTWFILAFLLVTTGCAGLKARKEEKMAAEQWVRTAESTIQSAIEANANDRKIREARADLGGATEFLRSKKYKAARVSAQSANSIAQQAIEEEEQRKQEEARQQKEEEDKQKATQKKSTTKKKK